MLSFNTREFLEATKRVNARLDQVPYALSRAMNDAVTATRQSLISSTWPRHMRVRTAQFMRSALQTNFSTKGNLRVELYDSLGRANLALHAAGGTRVPTRGRTISIPNQQYIKLTARGVDKTMLPSALIATTPRRALRVTQGGIFIGQGGLLHLMYLFKRSVQIRKDVDFDADFNREMVTNMRRAFPVRMAEAMRTAR